MKSHMDKCQTILQIGIYRVHVEDSLLDCRFPLCKYFWLNFNYLSQNIDKSLEGAIE